MLGIHCFFSQPVQQGRDVSGVYKTYIPGKIFSNYALYTMLLSALQWKKTNGNIKLYCDASVYEQLRQFRLLSCWDDIEVLRDDSVDRWINLQVFWSAVKFLVYERQYEPFVCIDTDLIVWKKLDICPDMDKAVSDMMKMQYDAEHSEKPSVDMSAHPTALMLAAVLSAEAHDEIQKRVLYEFGYHIGRWIYLVDAADDIEKDIKSNGFNPFVNKKTGEVKSSDFIKAVLNRSLARAYDAYNLLNFTDFKGILDNMMLLGFPASQNRVTSKLDTEVNNE